MFTMIPGADIERQEAVTNWVLRILNSETLAERRTTFPLTGYTLYRDNRPITLLAGPWLLDNSRLYMATESAAVPAHTRIQVLSALLSLTNPARRQELELSLANAITRALLGQYREMTLGLIQPFATNATVTRIAFSADRSQVAAYIGDGWYTPAGDPVEVGDGWVICEMPAT